MLSEPVGESAPEPEDDFAALEWAAEQEAFDPKILLKLQQAHRVLTDHLEAVMEEALEASQAVHDTHAAYTALLYSNVYALKAQAHRTGHTIQQVNSVLGIDESDQGV